MKVGSRWPLPGKPLPRIALAFQNNLAHMLMRGAIWRNGYYAGTFGEYDMNAIRVQIEQVARSRCPIEGVDS